jgi:hypothetical protein
LGGAGFDQDFREEGDFEQDQRGGNVVLESAGFVKEKSRTGFSLFGLSGCLAGRAKVKSLKAALRNDSG